MAKGGGKKKVIYPKGFDLRPPQVMEYIGFELETVTPTCIQGRFVVSERSAQAHGVLHGGISAFIAESLGSLGAFVVFGFQPVAGVDLSISHLRAAPIGLEIEAKATPVHIGGRLHVWEVKFISATSSSKGLPKQESSQTSEPDLIAVSKLIVTVQPSKRAAKLQDDKAIPSRL